MPQAQWERELDQGTARVNPATGSLYSTTSWAAVDLEPYKRGEQVIAPPLFLHRDDGKALIYPGRPHVFFGESESLKTWAALMACKSVVVAGYKALYVDFEGSEPSFVERARHVGIADGYIGQSLNYVRPIEPLRKDAEVDFWHREVDLFEPTLVVLDGVTEFYALQGWDINKATDAATFQKTFAFHKYGIASIAIDHTAKDAGRGALGSQHKRAGLDGAEYLFESVTHGGRGGTSVAKVRVTKDAPTCGWLPGGVNTSSARFALAPRRVSPHREAGVFLGALSDSRVGLASTTEGPMNLLNRYRFRRVQRDINEMPHEVAAWAMRRCASEGVGDLRLLRALSQRALETSPPELRSTYAKWAKAYAEGRRVKISVMTVTPEPEADEELIRAVDEAMTGWDS